MTDDAYKGQCLCGGTTVALPAQPTESVLCNCYNCRRTNGGLPSWVYVVPKETLNIQNTGGDLQKFQDKATKSGHAVERIRCQVCGSPIANFPTSPEKAGKGIVPTGLFDFESVPKPNLEIFVECRPKWMKPVDGAGQVQSE